MLLNLPKPFFSVLAVFLCPVVSIDYDGQKIRVAFQVVANNNKNILLENVYLGENISGTAMATKSMNSPIHSNAISKTSKVSNMLKRPVVSKSSTFNSYAVYRYGERIADTPSTYYTDEGLANGLYTYSISSLYSTPDEESLLSNEVEIRIGPNSIRSIFTTTDISLYPVPASEVLNIELNGLSGNMDFEMYTLLGKSV